MGATVDRVILTDLPELVPTLQRCARQNMKRFPSPAPAPAPQAELTAQPLTWGVLDDVAALVCHWPPPRLVLCSDVVYPWREGHMEALVESLSALVTDREQHVWMGWEPRGRLATDRPLLLTVDETHDALKELGAAWTLDAVWECARPCDTEDFASIYLDAGRFFNLMRDERGFEVRLVVTSMRETVSYEGLDLAGDTGNAPHLFVFRRPPPPPTVQ